MSQCQLRLWQKPVNVTTSLLQSGLVLWRFQIACAGLHLLAFPCHFDRVSLRLRRRSLSTFCVVEIFSLRRRPRRFCSIRRLSCHDFNRFFHRDSSVPKQRTRDLNITDHSSANFVVFKSTKRVYFAMTRNLWLTTLWLYLFLIHTKSFNSPHVDMALLYQNAMNVLPTLFSRALANLSAMCPHFLHALACLGVNLKP